MLAPLAWSIGTELPTVRLAWSRPKRPTAPPSSWAARLRTCPLSWPRIPRGRPSCAPTPARSMPRWSRRAWASCPMAASWSLAARVAAAAPFNTTTSPATTRNLRACTHPARCWVLPLTKVIMFMPSAVEALADRARFCPRSSPTMPRAITGRPWPRCPRRRCAVGGCRRRRPCVRLRRHHRVRANLFRCLSLHDRPEHLGRGRVAPRRHRSQRCDPRLGRKDVRIGGRDCRGHHRQRRELQRGDQLLERRDRAAGAGQFGSGNRRSARPHRDRRRQRRFGQSHRCCLHEPATQSTGCGAGLHIHRAHHREPRCRLQLPNPFHRQSTTDLQPDFGALGHDGRCQHGPRHLDAKLCPGSGRGEQLYHPGQQRGRFRLQNRQRGSRPAGADGIDRCRVFDQHDHAHLESLARPDGRAVQRRPAILSPESPRLGRHLHLFNDWQQHEQFIHDWRTRLRQGRHLHGQCRELGRCLVATLGGCQRDLVDSRQFSAGALLLAGRRGLGRHDAGDRRADDADYSDRRRQSGADLLGRQRPRHGIDRPSNRTRLVHARRQRSGTGQHHLPGQQRGGLGPADDSIPGRRARGACRYLAGAR